MEKDNKQAFSGKLLQEREKSLVLALADAAGLFFDFNITKNRMEGTPIKIVDGKVFKLLDWLGLPEHCTYTLFTEKIPGVVPEDKELFEHYADINYLKQCYAEGQRKIQFSYSYHDVFGNKNITHETIMLYEDATTGDLMAIAYLKYETDLLLAKQKSKAAREVSYRDPLTQCYNRRKLEDVARPYMSQPDAKCAFMMLDLDGFKQVNDSLGHTYGDTLLVEIAADIQSLLDSDDLLVRLGGDEFVIFFPGARTYRSLCRKAEQLLQKCQRIVTTLDGKDLYVTVSIGICMFPDFGKTYESLYEHVDAALYLSKNKGKNCYSFYRELSDEDFHEFLQKEVTMPENLVEAYGHFTDADCRTVLDSYTHTAIYVVSAEEHKLLFYNKRLRELFPNIKIGAICRDILHNDCRVCPTRLLNENTDYAHIVAYNTGFGQEVELSATKMMWQGKVPAYIINIFPRYHANMDEDY